MKKTKINALWPVIAVACVLALSGCHSAKSKGNYSSYSYGTQPAAGSTGASSAKTTGSDSEAMRQQQAAGGEQITVPLYQETVKIGKREVDAGGVRIRKEVKTETMKEPLQLRQETLTFERLPAEAQDSSGKKAAAAPQGSQLGTPFQPGEVVIRLHKEEPMVDRQMTQSGRIVAQKGSNTQEVTVKEDVRREQVDIEKLGNPENVTIPENLQSPGAVGGTPTTGGEQTGAGSSGQKAGK